MPGTHGSFPLPPLHTVRTLIRLPVAADSALLLRYRIDNRAHFEPWEPRREDAWYTAEGCAQSIHRARIEAHADRAYALLVLAPDEGEILATVHLTNVVRGAFQACHLGFGTAAAWQGRGLMHEALVAVLDLAFGTLDLHRVMANHLPHNLRSASLLARLGFEREGLAREYLRIAGRWQDHVLTARVRPHPSAADTEAAP